MAYQSGEFSAPGLDELGAPPAVGIYDNTLILFGGTASNVSGQPKMIQTTFDLSSLSSGSPTNSEPIDTEALTNPKNWNTGDMTLTDTVPYTYSRCAAVTTPDAVYAFWHHYIGGPFGSLFESSSDLRAAKYSGGLGSSIRLLESDGKTAPVPLMQVSEPITALEAFAEVSATGFGDNLIIYACAQATSATNSTGGIYLAIYDTTKIDPDENTWTADWHTYLPASQMELFNGLPEPFAQINNTGRNISLDWFSMAVADGGNLAYFLAISFAPQTPAVNGVMLFLPLGVTSNTSGGINLSVDTSLLHIGVTANPNAVQGSFLASPIMRDPAGRLRAYDLANSWAGYLITTQPPTAHNPELPWSPEIDRFTSQAGFNIAPTALFYVFPKGSQTTFNNLPATEYAVYEFVFYNQCQVNRFGTIEMIPNYCTSIPIQNQDGTPPPAPEETINIIAGIIDGPIPLPIANYQGVDLGSSESDQGDVTYGATSTSTLSRQLTNSWTIGIETSGEVTQGIGATWNLSANYGMGSVSGNTKALSTSYSLTNSAIVETNGPGPILNPFGTLRGVSAQISATAYRFLDPSGNPVSDATTADSGQASKLTTMLTTFFQPSALSYTPYSVTPGDLTSYTPEAWNAKMKSLGYTGDNYYGDIICTNAYPFGNPEQPYLPFSWSEDSKSAGSFTRFTSSYTEQSWTLDASIFAGMSGGGGFSIFGLGEEAQVSWLAGSTSTHTSTSDENTETDWGISFSDSWGPTVTSTDPNAVVKYDFRLFFLPVPTTPSTLPPTYWTQELIKYMPNGSYPSAKNIDPNSCCWRIVFVVTSIEYGPGATLTPYQYDFSLDQRSVYEDNDSTAAKT